MTHSDFNREAAEHQQALRATVATCEASFAQAQDEFRAVESRWDALAERREEYQVLEDACRSIEALADAGLSRQFWGTRATDDEVATHLVGVRATVAEVAAELDAVATERDAARVKVDRALDDVEIAEEDLRQAVEQNERRKTEWLVEREESDVPRRLLVMPWMRRQSDDARFHRSLAGSFAMALLLGLVIPWIDIPIPERDQLIEVPERLAQFIRKEQPRPIPKAAPIPEERKVEVPPEPKKPVPEVVPPEVTPETRIAEVAEPVSKPETPRESVASKGLLAFRETFSNMASGQPSARLGAKARISNAGDTATGYAQRSMISTNGPGSSGGINLASLSRDVGSGGAGGQMEGVSVTRAESAIGGTGGDDRPLSSGAAAGRTDEEIQIVFDRYKAALYRLYNRELRKDPTLRGQMVLRLTIEPDGSVS
jgi:hypothetical protein